MSRMITILQWQTHRFWSQLTLAHAIMIAMVIWLLGMWLWILPLYQIRTLQLEGQNHRMEKFIAAQPKLPIAQTALAQPAISLWSYDRLLILAAQQTVALGEYRELTVSSGPQYQITVQGSWLHIRKFLAAIQDPNFGLVTIHSLEIQRNKTTNQASLTLVISG